MTVDSHLFSNKQAFYDWLQSNVETSDGVWLTFGKTSKVKTLSASEALEIALCFGWIDGQMKKIDDNQYIKYFAQRRPNSKWSEKNKRLVQELDKKGLLTEYGKKKIAEAKENGRWNQSYVVTVTDTDIQDLTELIKPHEPAHTNFLNMSPSVQKTYTKAYLDAKTDKGRTQRLTWMIDRLNNNLKPM